MSFIVHEFNKEQIIILFELMHLNWFCTMEKIDRIHTSEVWESAYTWVENYLIGKLIKYIKLWYMTLAGEKYFEKW